MTKTEVILEYNNASNKIKYDQNRGDYGVQQLIQETTLFSQSCKFKINWPSSFSVWEYAFQSLQFLWL